MSDTRTPEERRAMTAEQHLQHAERYASRASYFTDGTPHGRPHNPEGASLMTALAQVHATCAVARMLHELKPQHWGPR